MADELADTGAGAGVQALAPATAAALSDVLSTRHREPLGGGDGGWFAWKTGTSSARRDAVAVGHNGRFAVGVWVGRFAGGGDALYSGRTSAEPLLACLFADARLRVPMHVAPLAAAELHVPRPLAVTMAAERQLTAKAAGLATAPAADAHVRIQSPRDGASFVAWSGPVPVALEARWVDPRTGIARPTSATGTWLLDGRPLPPDAMHARLPVGRYELTFVDEGRRTDTVRFTVVERTAG